MSRRTIVPLAVSVIVGIAALATVSTDALAKKARVAPAPALVAAPVVVVDSTGPVADRIPRCFNSPILYPYPPCY